MYAESAAAPPEPSGSSMSGPPPGVAVARVSAAILAVLYLAVIALPVFWLARAFRARCERRRQDRALVQELLPQAEGPAAAACPAAPRSSCEVCHVVSFFLLFFFFFTFTFTNASNAPNTGCQQIMENVVLRVLHHRRALFVFFLSPPAHPSMFFPCISTTNHQPPPT